MFYPLIDLESHLHLTARLRLSDVLDVSQQSDKDSEMAFAVSLLHAKQGKKLESECIPNSLISDNKSELRCPKELRHEKGISVGWREEQPFRIGTMVAIAHVDFDSNSGMVILLHFGYPR
jgi:hypothetical protein